jgi:hypothetical protein
LALVSFSSVFFVDFLGINIKNSGVKSSVLII